MLDQGKIPVFQDMPSSYDAKYFAASLYAALLVGSRWCVSQTGGFISRRSLVAGSEPCERADRKCLNPEGFLFKVAIPLFGTWSHRLCEGFAMRLIHSEYLRKSRLLREYAMLVLLRGRSGARDADRGELGDAINKAAYPQP